MDTHTKMAETPHGLDQFEVAVKCLNDLVGAEVLHGPVYSERHDGIVTLRCNLATVISMNAAKMNAAKIEGASATSLLSLIKQRLVFRLGEMRDTIDVTLKRLQE